ncbi:hypothetical protein FRC04_008166 [Tulasnella sp. 424]|nr:hypothetical protein FRC04_008166 [Tulasnella sp. 424]KAG8974450.1 hypothetical protein FRC05_007249 [Tulasnella sp. 425]
MVGNPQSKVRATPSKGHSKPKPKEKLFHPQSRKAAQLERAHLRQHKLTSAKSKRGKVQNERNDRFVFFHHALTSDVPSLTLPEIHDIIKDVWLHRHDVAIAEEAATRRKGEPRSSKEDKLLAAKEADKEEYRTGLEIPDLTDPTTVELFRKWEDGDPNYLPLLRMIRVSSADHEKFVITRRGRREEELEAKAAKEAKAVSKAAAKDPNVMAID